MRQVFRTIIVLAAMTVMAGQPAWADSVITTVDNWAELSSAINDGAVIELSGDDVYYAEGSTIAIESGTVTIDGKGHTIDAQRLNVHIFEVNEGATLTLKNLILKNDTLDNENKKVPSNYNGGAIYIDRGTLIVDKCTFTNNGSKTEKGGAIYNNMGTLKITNSKFEKNSKYDRAIYNYADEDNLFKLTMINCTMVEDKVCVNYNDNERRLDDKRDIDFLTTEYNANIPAIVYENTPVPIQISGVDPDYTGRDSVSITNTIYGCWINIINGEGQVTMSLDVNRYTARLKNFISLSEKAFDRDDTRPYLEIDFKVITYNSFSALEDMISKATDNTVTLDQNYTYDSKTDPGNIRIVDKTLTIHGNGHSINGKGNNGDTLFLIEDDSDVSIDNITLENGNGRLQSQLGSQIRMGGAIYATGNSILNIGADVTISGSACGIYNEGSLRFTGIPTFNCTDVDIWLAEDNVIGFSGDPIVLSAAPTTKIKVGITNEAPYMFCKGFDGMVKVGDDVLNPEDVFTSSQYGDYAVGYTQDTSNGLYEAGIAGLTEITFPAGKSTYFDDRALALYETNDNLKFYTVTDVDETNASVEVTEFDGKLFGQNTPLIVSNETGAAITAKFIEAFDGPMANYYTNIGLADLNDLENLEELYDLDDGKRIYFGFEGTIEALEEIYTLNGMTYYGFNGTGFVRLSRLGPIAAHRCWLGLGEPQFDEPIGARSLTINWPDGTTTGISEKGGANSHNVAAAEGWYGIDGRQLDGEPTGKGIYIRRNGNKAEKLIIK